MVEAKAESPMTPCVSASNQALRTIRLYGKLGALYGRTFRMAVSTPAEAVRALCSQLPGFERFLTHAKDRGMTFAVFVGRRNIGEDELKFPADGDIRIAPVLAGSKKNGVFQIIVGIVLVVVGAYTSNPALVANGIVMITGGVVQMLAPQPKGRSSQDRPDNQPSYAFNGPINTQAQGNPVPLGYGRMTIGSAVVSAGILAEDVYVPTFTASGGGGGGTGGGGGGGSPPWHSEIEA